MSKDSPDLFWAKYSHHSGSKLHIQLFQRDECFGRMTVAAAQALVESLQAALKAASSEPGAHSVPDRAPRPKPEANPGLPTLEDMPRLVRAEDLVGPLKMPLGGVYNFLKSVPEKFLVRMGRRLRVKEREFLEWVGSGCPR
ncbi:MAG: hypothetical protein KF760_17800 [Candidatus Eremiobacteraeota bacterium]|nr:hypothetical protein [Candidatus Eremiobacteraeota bacterium]MCW5869235.1 hypothetical protein [Candidatus Eremiobacteraeota bacterium]